jgi:hypothetical protein
MGLRDSTTIDLIQLPAPFETEPCKLVLVIIDATSDLSDADRYTLLIKKLAAYATYLADPGFSTKHPGIAPADVIVRVLTVMPPTIDMQLVSAIRTKEGPRLRVFFDDYHAYMKKVKGLGTKPPSMN